MRFENRMVKRKEAGRRAPRSGDDAEVDGAGQVLLMGNSGAIDGVESDAEAGSEASDGEVHDLGTGDYLAERIGSSVDEDDVDSDSGNDDGDEEEEEEEEGESESGDDVQEEAEEDSNGGEEQRRDLWDSDGDDEAGADAEVKDEEPTVVAVKATGKSGARVAKPSVREKPSLPRGDRLKIKQGAARHQHEQEGRIVPESDSEEDGPVMRNPVGNVPMEWYKDEKHIGYGLDGKKILRRHNKDSLDRHIDKADDPEAWRSVYDEVNDEELRLTDAEVKLLKHLRSGRYEPGIDPYEDYPAPIDDPLLKIHPAHNRPTPKSQFVPKKYEAKMVVKYVRMIRAGKLLRPPEPLPEEERYNFDVWDRDDDVKHRGAVPIPAPKPKLPGHAESYNPPVEYLLSKEETEAMMRQDPADRPLNFVPRSFDALRKVPLYDRLIQERFERCLDLYLCPRAVKKRMNVDPKSLLPKLPKPQDLKPYPAVLTIMYEGHTDKVFSISMSPSGQHFASASADGSVRLWETSTGRCWRSWHLKAPVKCVAWNPSQLLPIVAAAVGSEVLLLDASVGYAGEAGSAVKEVLARGREAMAAKGGGTKPLVEFLDVSDAQAQDLILLRVKHSKDVIQATWHYKGDYFATLSPASNTKAVLIHQLSKLQCQCPFAKSKADAQKVMFHPSKPFLFVATKKNVKVYNLLKQELTKNLSGGFKWLSSFDIHPGGDNVCCCTYDRRLTWWDMDLSTKPYKTMRYNNTGLKSISIHRRLPLFATGGEDGVVYVFHGMVYNDLMDNPLIVPLKRIHAHACTGTDGVMDCVFHPTQPWLLTCGVDKTIRLFTET